MSMFQQQVTARATQPSLIAKWFTSRSVSRHLRIFIPYSKIDDSHTFTVWCDDPAARATISKNRAAICHQSQSCLTNLLHYLLRLFQNYRVWDHVKCPCYQEMVWFWKIKQLFARQKLNKKCCRKILVCHYSVFNATWNSEKQVKNLLDFYKWYANNAVYKNNSTITKLLMIKQPTEKQNVWRIFPAVIQL